MNWVLPSALLLATFVAAFIQSSLGGLRSVIAAQPDLLPALVIYAALNTRLATTTATAVVGALAHDALSSGPFGLTVLPVTSLGIVLNIRRDVLLKDSRWAQALIGGGGAVAVALGSLAILFLIWPVLSNPPDPSFLPEQRQGTTFLPNLGLATVWQLSLIGLFGALITPLVFWAFRWIESTLDYPPLAPSLPRPDREIKRGRF
jgi:cell shape-determining protein MreD